MKWGRLALRARFWCSEIIDAVLPPKARALRTKNRNAEDISLAPSSHALLGERIVTLMNYRSFAAQDLIRSLKYDRSAHAAHVCAQILAEYLIEEIASIRLFSTRPVLLVPIPLHTSRRRERGFNQIALVLERLPEEFHNGTAARVEGAALMRTKATPPQTRLARRERIKNVAGAFAVADKALVKRAHVFLIDDVTTTGATLVNAGKPLKKCGAEITLLALARA